MSEDTKSAIIVYTMYTIAMPAIILIIAIDLIIKTPYNHDTH